MQVIKFIIGSLLIVMGAVFWYFGVEAAPQPTKRYIDFPPIGESQSYTGFKIPQQGGYQVVSLLLLREICSDLRVNTLQYQLHLSSRGDTILHTGVSAWCNSKNVWHLANIERQDPPKVVQGYTWELQVDRQGIHYKPVRIFQSYLFWWAEMFFALGAGLFFWFMDTHYKNKNATWQNI